MEYYKDQLRIILNNYRAMNNRLIAESNSYPPGTLSHAIINGKDYYRHNYHENGKMKRVGITHNDTLIRQLARKEYLRLASNHYDSTIASLSKFIDGFQTLEHDAILQKVKSAYRELPADYFNKPSKTVTDNVKSIDIINDPDYLPEIRAKKWAALPYTKSNFKPEELKHTTSRGELMRSKSEVLIAEQYYSQGIDFKYEAIIQVGPYEFAPDFVFFGKNGHTFYHEHAGMMGDLKYRNRHNWKMARYQEAGIFPWKNLIITYDYDDHINMQEIQAIINGMVKPRLMHYGR